MLTSNLDIADRLINGQIGTLFNFQYSEGTITKIYVKFDDVNAGMIKRDSNNFAKVNGVVPFERIELDIMLSKSSTIFVKRTQFPIILAWACTIHKVQELILLNLAISLQRDKQATFGAGQFYVAVIRAIALSKVSLIRDLKSDMINARARYDKYIIRI